MGLTTNPTVVDQLSELGKLLNQGVIPVEVGVLVFIILRLCLKSNGRDERKAKLTGAKLSLHARLLILRVLMK
jgi:hypothetical protein